MISLHKALATVVLFVHYCGSLQHNHSRPPSTMHRTERIDLPQNSIGTKHTLLFHRWGPPSANEADSPTPVPQCYIQAALHADELPGLLVCHHLIHLLDAAAARGDVLQRICMAPYANPIGLSQHLLGTHVGRFSIESGVNFNRNWLCVADTVAERLTRDEAAGGLRLRLRECGDGDDDSAPSATHNVKVIRAAILEAIDAKAGFSADAVLKRLLLREAALSDLCLDLHCDAESIMHMYTHNNLWPAFADLAAELGSHCHLLATTSGGDPFDETVSHLWADLQAKFPEYTVPMACASVTIELRGEMDVSDELALRDAQAIFRVLQRRGYISAPSPPFATPSPQAAPTSTPTPTANVPTPPLPLPPLPPLLRDATPLDAVDMIEAPCPGVVVWRVQLGESVSCGQLLGEIVNMQDPDAPRVAIASKTAGVVFSRKRHRLVVPGQVIVKIAGEKALEWRSGMLLTAR